MTESTVAHSTAAADPVPAGMVRVACIQTTATPDMAEGLDRIDDAVGRAAAGGAALAMLPEMSAMLAPGPEQRAAAVVEDDHPAVGRFAAIAPPRLRALVTPITRAPFPVASMLIMHVSY